MLTQIKKKEKQTFLFQTKHMLDKRKLSGIRESLCTAKGVNSPRRHNDS